MHEYFLHRVSATEDAHVPFPLDLPLDQRDAYMAKPPRDVLAACERVRRVQVDATPTQRAEVVAAPIVPEVPAVPSTEA